MEKNEKPLTPEMIKAADLERKWKLVLGSEEGLDYLDKAGTFGELLQEKYGGETNNCWLLHILAGSGKIAEFSRFDFDGVDSIEQFVTDCYNELFPPQGNNQVKE